MKSPKIFVLAPLVRADFTDRRGLNVVQLVAHGSVRASRSFPRRRLRDPSDGRKDKKKGRFQKREHEDDEVQPWIEGGTKKPKAGMDSDSRSRIF